MPTRLTLIHALTPLHAGTGQAAGAIDLPIARERPTGIPYLPGSSLKGALRARESGDMKHALFGPETPNASEHAGAVQFADAHLLLLPVRSLWGTFAWVTSPYLLQRFARDLREAGGQIKLPEAPALEACLVANGSKLLNDNRVILEDLDFKAHTTLAPDLLKFIADGLPELSARLCVVHDDVMSTLMETATEVRARIRLQEDTKTVAKGALWYEESLPTESILYGLVVASDARGHKASDLLAHLTNTTKSGNVQLGGKATVGRGVCAVRILDGGAK
jgi:CRISPR-associated protein Cmr4